MKTIQTGNPHVRVRAVDDAVFVIKQRAASGLTVNLYLLRSLDGDTLIDAGFYERLGDLADGLKACGSSLQQLRRVLYTHTHIDHMGGGPDLASHAPHVEHVIFDQTPRIVETDYYTHVRSMQRWSRWLAQCLWDEPDLHAQIAGSKGDQLSKRERALGGRGLGGEAAGAGSRVRWAAPGERFVAGRYHLELLPTPGHDPSHVVLWDRAEHVTFTGDVVLAVETPLTSVMGDHVGSYLASLDRLAELPVTRAFPGHGAPFSRFARRIGRSRAFVEQRLDAVTLRLSDGPASVSALTKAVWGARPVEPIRFPLALANVESAVKYLVERGRVRWLEPMDDGAGPLLELTG